MDRYQDIRLLPDPEFPETVLMNALFSKLHRALARMQNRAIGVSFPHFENASRGLGDVLRLHGTGAELERLAATNWMAAMDGLVHDTPIRPVPPHARHRGVRRVQAKSNPERLRRRYMKRHGAGPEEAQKAIPDEVAETLQLPYLQLHSHSTGQRFPLFIRHGPIQETPTAGEFNTYGLSKTATIPWF